MKKMLIVGLLSILSGLVCLSAQEKGDMYLSGSLGMSGGNSTSLSGGSTVKSPGGFSVSITPQFGYFVMDNLEIHLGLGYSFQKDPSFGEESSTNISSFSIVPGINYYVGIVDGKFYYTPGLDFSVGFGGANYKSEAGKERLYDATDISVTLSLLSFEYRPVDGFGISFRAGSAGYAYKNMKNTSGTSMSSNSFSFGFNLSASLGFRCYF